MCAFVVSITRACVIVYGFVYILCFPKWWPCWKIVDVANLCMYAGLASATLTTRACVIVYGYRYVRRHRPDIVDVKRLSEVNCIVANS